MHPFEIPSSLFMLLCSVVGIVCALIFISVVILDRQCRTMTTLLVLNSIIAGFVVNIVYACQALYQLLSDGNDQLCVFRGFLLHGTSGLLYHTFCVQAFYRLSTTIPARQRCRRLKGVIVIIVLLQWLISLTFGLPILLNDQIKYQAGSRICQVSMNDLYGFLYLGTWIYLLPLPILIGIYIRIVCYIKQNSFPTVIRQNICEQQRQQRELRIFRRIIMPVIALFIAGFPYLLFFLIIQFRHLSTPPYAQRISFMFLSFGQGMSMLLCLINTDDVRKCMINGIKKSNDVEDNDGYNASVLLNSQFKYLRYTLDKNNRLVTKN